MRLHRCLPIALALLTLIEGPGALAAGVHEIQAPPPELRVHWVDTQGELLTEPESYVRAHWVWNDDQVDSPKLEKGGPALRIEVDATNIPAGWRLLRAEGTDGEVVSLAAARPAKVNEPRIRHIVFDQLALTATYGLSFKDTSTGKETHLAAEITVESATPALLLRPRSCPRHSMKLEPQTTDGHHLFIGLYCYDDYWNTNFYLVRSRDSSWAYAGMPAESQPRALSYKIENAAENSSYSGDPIRIRTRDRNDAVTETVIRYSTSKDEN